MGTQDMKRKLTAIFSADVEGYSRLMGEDELATVQTLTSYKETMEKLIRHYRGRVVDSTGDNLLAEFVSVVDAVQCALEVQQILSQKNEELPENRRMLFRIGINLGDVIEEGNRIFGDGVNIAARVESLAEGGGICISGSAFEQIENKLALGYQYMGEHTVKNIVKPIKVYRVPMGPVEDKRKKFMVKGWRRAAIAAVAVLIFAGVALLLRNYYFLPPPIEPASMEKMALPLPDKPSIAVMAFANMSGDPKQEYFSDGLTEEIITTLSKVSDLFVIARESTFSYKGKPVKVKQIAEELGVQYVLEGSVRKGKDRVRVTAQLIDALKGHHLWSDSYDREVKDILAVQSEIAKKIITALEVKLTEGEQARLYAKGTDNVEAWDLGLRAWKLGVKYSKENMAKARVLLDGGLKLDPHYAFLWTVLGHTHFIDARMPWTESRAGSYKRALECMKKALTINEEDPIAHAYIGTIYLLQRQHDKAIVEGQMAISIDPNYADGYAMLSQIMRFSGRFEEALTLIKKGMRLCPRPRVFYPWTLGYTYVMLGRYEEAVSVAKQVQERCRKGECPPWFVKPILIASYMGLGRKEEARAEAEELLRLFPKFSLEYVRENNPYKDPAHVERLVSALREAGIPETPPLPLPDKPSIAVVPFVNMSGDPKQEYFSDGISEEIIASISKIPRLFVISRTSSFKYKGKAVDVKQVGRELGVKYVLEGSVQRSGDRLRITAQLIDAITGRHLWAERYDRRFKDLFALQDEITIKVLLSLLAKLTDGERILMMRPTHNLNLKAIEKIFEATRYLQAFNKESNAMARHLAEEAIAIDPQYGGAYDTLACTYFFDVMLGSSKSPRMSLAQATKLLHKAIALCKDYPLPYSHLCFVYTMQRQYEKAIAEGEKAVALNPNSDHALAWLGMAMDRAGRSEEALALYKQAIRLCPFPPSYYYINLGNAYRSLKKYEEAIAEYNKALHLTPKNVAAFTCLAICYSLLGREEEARAAAAELLRINPTWSLKAWEKRFSYKDQTLKERWRDALHKAGLS